MKGRRVLITGAGGFVGPHLAREILAAGGRVAGLGIEPAPAAVAFDSWHAADLLDGEALAAALAAAAPDAVVHLAGQSSAARSFERPAETLHVNVMGTWSLLEAVRLRCPGARVLVVGSGEVYGPQPAGSRTPEDTPFAPASPYALSKAVADSLAEAHARGAGLDVVRVRAFSHTGPGQAPAFVVPSFARQIAEIEAGRAAPVLRVGNLAVTRDLCDVREVVKAYAALLERGRAGAVYNVCRGEGVELTEVVRRMVALSGLALRVEPDPARMRPADVPWLVGDPAAIARDTGWRAELPLERTLRDVLDEWRARPAA